MAVGMVVTGFTCSAACMHCGSGAAPLSPAVDATTPDRDAGLVVDATLPVVDASVEDAPVERPSYDSGQIGACTPEPGWSVVPTEGPACTVLVPDDVHVRIPNPKWIPCTNGRAGCQELERIGPVIPRPNPSRATVIGRATGKLQLALEWEREVGACMRSVIVDLSNMNAPNVLGAWDGTGVAPDGNGYCLGQMFPSTGDTGLIFGRPKSTSFAVGTDLSMQKIIAKAHPEDGFHAYASEAVFATSIATAGLVFRMPFGSNQAVTVRTPAGVSALILEGVEGGDVFARSNYGTDNWMQWYRADADGQARLMLSRPSAHVSHLRSDGAHLYWIEGSGNPGNFWPQPKMEAWSATYSSDLDAVRASARRLADVSGTLNRVEEAAAFNGFYAYTGSAPTVIAVREQDGAVQVVDVGPNRGAAVPLYITSTEVWVHYFSGPTAAGIARIQLAPWP